MPSRSAVTGKYVTPGFAKKNPQKTVNERPSKPAAPKAPTPAAKKK